MSTACRLTLLCWAAQTGAVIVEDDYDSEFRYRGRPLTALQGWMKPGAWCTWARSARRSFPGCAWAFSWLRPAWSKRSRAPVPRRRHRLRCSNKPRSASSWREGHFATHLRRMRGAYRERSEALLAALKTDCGGVLVPGANGTGMQLTATLPSSLADYRVRDEAARQGVEGRGAFLLLFEKPPPQRPRVRLWWLSGRQKCVREPPSWLVPLNWSSHRIDLKPASVRCGASLGGADSVDQVDSPAGKTANLSEFKPETTLRRRKERLSCIGDQRVDDQSELIHQPGLHEADVVRPFFGRSGQRVPGVRCTVPADHSRRFRHGRQQNFVRRKSSPKFASNEQARTGSFVVGTRATVVACT